MRVRSILIGLFGAAGLISGADAATVSAVQGSANFSQGGGFSPIAVGTVLNAGDKVRVTQGTLTITLNDGCSVTVQSGRVFTVPAAGNCPTPVVNTAPGLPPIVGPVVIGAVAAAAIIASNPVSP